MHCLIWCIRLERNNKAFNNIKDSAPKVADKIITTSHTWYNYRSRNGGGKTESFAKCLAMELAIARQTTPPLLAFVFAVRFVFAFVEFSAISLSGETTVS
ncbi:hypothetical protein LXL04_011621 [Taraxacum kok-saghyz]